MQHRHIWTNKGEIQCKAYIIIINTVGKNFLYARPINSRIDALSNFPYVIYVMYLYYIVRKGFSYIQHNLSNWIPIFVLRFYSLLYYVMCLCVRCVCSYSAKQFDASFHGNSRKNELLIFCFFRLANVSWELQFSEIMKKTPINFLCA